MLTFLRNCLILMAMLSGAAANSQEQVVAGDSKIEFQSIYTEIMSAHLARTTFDTSKLSVWDDGLQLEGWVQKTLEAEDINGVVDSAETDDYWRVTIKEVPLGFMEPVDQGRIFSVTETVSAEFMKGIGLPTTNDGPQMFVRFYEYCEDCATGGGEVPGVIPLSPGCYRTPFGVKCIRHQQ